MILELGVIGLYGETAEIISSTKLEIISFFSIKCECILYNWLGQNEVGYLLEKLLQWMWTTQLELEVIVACHPAVLFG